MTLHSYRTNAQRTINLKIMLKFLPINKISEGKQKPCNAVK